MAGPTAEYFNNLDVANRACQLLGVPQIVAFTDDTRQANEMAFAIDKVRRAELQRNLWRFCIRTVALRAIDDTVMEYVPAAWNSSDTYITGSIVSYNNQVWTALQPVIANQEPDTSPTYWDVYFGTMVATAWADPTVSTNTAVAGGYYPGELVYVLSGTTATFYMSLQNGNQDNPSTIPAWSATTTYKKYETVTYLASTYQSTIDLNLNNTPGGAQWQAVPGTQPQSLSGQHWLKLDGTFKSIDFVYPIGAGPSRQTTTLNAFQLPNGFLKMAPQDPKAGNTSYLGAPGARTIRDWRLEGDYLLTRDQNVIVVRFAADVVNVPSMTSMFCEGWACRVAAVTCETLTQSTAKLTMIAQEYKEFMGEARLSNAIELSSDEPPLDDWLACRV